ncbi:MAG: acetyl-CoA hydrolase, partial [Oscillospiraceae bacterium]|nr:acetyl-CoA hydrolase [Oscillospiraceae bacterium]
GPNYRWQFVVEWPDEAAGEKWFREELVPYFTARPEVNRFVSSRIMRDVVGCAFHRLVELWFDGPEEWQAAVAGAESLPRPEWAQEERFPFLRANFNIVGMFLPDMAASDNLSQYRGYITMR